MKKKKLILYFCIQYPLDINPGVLFFKIDFWVGVYSKIPFKKWTFYPKTRVYSRKIPKTGLFILPGAVFKIGAAIKRMRSVPV